VGAVNLFSHVLQRALKLSPPATRDLEVRRDLRVPVGDGVELLADRWAPRAGGDGLPCALVRTPYGRRQMGPGLARPLAERGFQVLVQSTRGTYGSGGEFVAFRYDRPDGLATLDWLLRQPWCTGPVVLAGASYLGYAQWAVADALPERVRAMVPAVTESALTLEFLRPDGLSLETPFGWGVMTAGQERRGAALRMASGALFGGRPLRRALGTLPLGDADVTALGRHSGYVQDILTHDGTDPYWADCDHRARVPAVTVPVGSVGGWYDIFLPGQLRDYLALRGAGRDDARLTVGPWTHASLGMARAMTRETLEFGLPHARGERPPDRAPVRLYVMGADEWRDAERWPPPDHPPTRYHLHPGGGLDTSPPAAGGSPNTSGGPDVEPADAVDGPGVEPPDAVGGPGVEPPDAGEPDRYRYDPADPTPAAGGVRLSGKAGRVDNTRLEARPDVVTYTTPPLATAVEVIGEVTAEIWFRSSLPYADVFVRLCDVDPRGRSYNVCDGLVSRTGADTLSLAAVRLWPTAYRFRPGHRIRVQVSSGAFPRYARNPGTGEPHATATTLRAADQEIHHDPAHPSAIILPVATDPRP
jgi:predicted acyl esterase